MLIFTHYRSLTETAAKSKARILTVSSYRPVLKTWHMLLEAQGYEAVSVVGTKGSEDLCKQGQFDIIILGQSVDDTDKKKLVEAFRQCCSVPIISIPSSAGGAIDGADIHAGPDPEELLDLIAGLMQTKLGPNI
jgi:PleD family two-component response regulator